MSNNLEKDIHSLAESYQAKYRNQLDVFSRHSIKTTVGESMSSHHFAAMGKMLDQQQAYYDFCEANANLGSLGKLPQIALDVITAAQTQSIMPLLASIQPLEEEHGIAYFRQTKSAGAYGGYTKDGLIADPRKLDNPGDGTLGNARKTFSTKQVTSQASYTISCNAPIRPYQVQVVIDGIGLGQDNGEGKLIGINVSGTVNYENGEIKVTVPTDEVSKLNQDKHVSAMVNLDVDMLDELDRIQNQLQTVDIVAEIFALSSDVGEFTNFAFNKRFGRSASEEVAQDLTNEMVRMLNTRAVKEIIGGFSGTATKWNPAAPQGVSYAEHKLTFVDGIAEAERQLHLQSGVNGANRYIVGSKAAAYLRGMPQFEATADASINSVGLFGYFDGIPVIRATGIVADTDMYLVANSGNYFNAPLVYAPYMPLIITSTVQSAANPFRSRTAAGEWSAIKSVNPNLVAKLEFTA